MKTLLEPMPNQQQTIKDEEESQDVECLPAMIDTMHTMMKTTPGVNNREFCYMHKPIS